MRGKARWREVSNRLRFFHFLFFFFFFFFIQQAPRLSGPGPTNEGSPFLSSFVKYRHSTVGSGDSAIFFLRIFLNRCISFEICDERRRGGGGWGRVSTTKVYTKIVE